MLTPVTAANAVPTLKQYEGWERARRAVRGDDLRSEKEQAASDLKELLEFVTDKRERLSPRATDRFVTAANLFLYAHGDDTVSADLSTDDRAAAERVRKAVARGETLTIDSLLGLSPATLRGRPKKKRHKHERLFLSAFYDHQIRQRYKTQKAALKAAAVNHKLGAYQPESLEREYQRWLAKRSNYLLWFFDLI